MHKQHTYPFARVVRGALVSWEPVVATAGFNRYLDDAVWSPCNRFIAVTTSQFVGILDAVTLSQLSIFNHLSHPNDVRLLGFSPDSRCLTLCTGGELISWDLQTGGPFGTILSGSGHQDAAPFSFEHSEDGKLVVVAYKSWYYDYSSASCEYDTSICTYNLLSGECVGSRHVPEGRMIYPIWTHDGYLQFATIGPKSITIWQSPFTLEHPPVEVTSFPAPDGITNANGFLFLPSFSRLAFTLKDTIQVWDVKASKLLLKSELTPDLKQSDLPCGSFSSNGRLFACTNTAGEVYVWEEYPTSYLLHQRLSFFTPNSISRSIPRLSPNSKSIIIPISSKIYRWHTRDQVLSLPSVSTGNSSHNCFILGFSLDDNFVAFTWRGGNTVTIIDLQSGEPKWNADMGMEISCLGVAGGVVIVLGKDSIVTWNLASGDRTILDHSSPARNLGMPRFMSISPDLSRIAVVRESPHSLEVDDVSTGSCLARIATRNLLRPQFTQDGCAAWAWSSVLYTEWEQCEIIEDGEFGTIELKYQRTPRTPRGFFQVSSRGYTVAGGGWVLGPGQKRLLWLPHRWRMEWNRTWGGQFLGLVDRGLSEVVVLEFLE